MRSIRSMGLAYCLAGLVMLNSGCAAIIVGAAAGVGTWIYTNGELENYFDRSLDRVYKASIAALSDLELTVAEKSKDKVTALIRAEYADGKKVVIHLNADDDKHTTMKIRVGAFGDEERSEMILKAVMNRL